MLPVDGAGGRPQDDPHMVPLHLSLLVIVMFDGKHHRPELIVHRGEVLMVVTQEVGPVTPGRVVNLKLGLDLRVAPHDPVTLPLLDVPGVLVARVHPVAAALHHHLGVGAGARGEDLLQPVSAGAAVTAGIMCAHTRCHPRGLLPRQGQRGHLTPLVIQTRGLEPVQQLEQLGHGAHVGCGRRGRDQLAHAPLVPGVSGVSDVRCHTRQAVRRHILHFTRQIDFGGNGKREFGVSRQETG